MAVTLVLIICFPLRLPLNFSVKHHIAQRKKRDEADIYPAAYDY